MAYILFIVDNIKIAISYSIIDIYELPIDDGSI